MGFDRFSFPTDILAGSGCRVDLPERLRALQVKKALVVTDVLFATLPSFDMVKEALAPIAFNVFSEVSGNPTISQVSAGVQAYKAGAYTGIIAVGGGAAMDVAKCIALMANHPGQLLDYEDGNKNALPVNQDIPPLVAIPTTAGTGSEVGRAAVVSEDDTKVKRIIFDVRLLPRAVFLDAELTLSLPPKLTAGTGMDALTHLLEAYLAPGNNPLCDGIAREGVNLVGRHLRNAVEYAADPKNTIAQHLEARDGMLRAAMMGAVAFQKGLGVNHSMAHALSTVCDLHHGLANAVILDVVMAFNRETAPERVAVLGRELGGDAADLVEEIQKLKKAVGIPERLEHVGVEAHQLPRLVELALADPCHHTNVRPVNEAAMVSLFAQAFNEAPGVVA